MNILIIGGTRNIGHFLAMRLIEMGHRLTILNRGISRDNLPENVSRLAADRTDINQMRRALSGRQFDVVVDTVIYEGYEAEAIINILDGQIGHYIFISSGQVYLVREGIEQPVKEADYNGPLIDQPEANTYDYEEWLYGSGKREAEDAFAQAYQTSGFPYTSLRLPMVNSERDYLNRLYGYLLRINDGGPILVPDTPTLPLRHVYVADVIEAIVCLIEQDAGQGKAYNIAQEEMLSLVDFLGIVGRQVNKIPNVVTVEREVLQTNGFLPDCSPFSDLWMSVLDNSLSKTELGMTYTPVEVYVENIVQHYQDNLPKKPPSYHRRRAEKQLVEALKS